MPPSYEEDHPALNLKDVEMRWKILQVLESDPTPEEVALALRAIEEHYKIEDDDGE